MKLWHFQLNQSIAKKSANSWRKNPPSLDFRKTETEAAFSRPYQLALTLL